MAHSMVIPSRLKTNLKKSLAFLLYFSGITAHILKKRTINQCIVLMYHRVQPKDRLAECLSHRSITMSADNFEKQMIFVSKYFNPISVNEMVDHLKHKIPFSSNQLLITFDDGWKDNFDYALPILNAYRLPAVVFLSTGFIDTQKRFWQERMTSLLRNVLLHKEADLQPIQDIFLGYDMAPLMTADKQKQDIEISHMIQKIKAEEYCNINEILEKLENIVSPSSSEYDSHDHPGDFLAWNDVNEMHKEGVIFGSHGVNHLILTRNDVDIDYELQYSKTEIENRLGTPVISISYPNGDYDQSIMDKTASAGYKIGFGTEFGYNHYQSNPLNLKRINVNEDASSTIPLFLGRILGLW